MNNIVRFLPLIAATVILGLVANSCNKVEMPDSVSLDGVSAISLSTKAAASPIFGLYETDFLAGQKIPAGKISVYNDYDNVYVTFATTDGWLMGRTHLFIGPKAVLMDPANGYVNKNGSPKNGHFPYGEAFDPVVTEWTFALPLDDLYAMFGLEPGNPEGGDVCPVVAAHAEVMKQVGTTDEGEPIWQTETAWGKGPNFVKKGNWSMYVEGYCVEFPDEDPPVEDPDYTYSFKEETAWAFNPDAPFKYVKKGNWATFIQYNGQPLTVILLAGQKETEMTVTLTPVDGGKVRMTFENIFGIAPENDGKWVLQDVKEAVKIQGYAKAPSGNPAPGQFNYYKGRELDVVVDAANYYGIHLDVAKLTVTEVPASE